MRSLSLRCLLTTGITLLSMALITSELHAADSKAAVTIRCGPLPVTILKQVQPIYPLDAKTKGIQGLVRIRAIINAEGLLDHLQVLEGPPALVPASLEAIKQWRYRPVKLNGKAVKVETSIDINFVIPPNKAVHK